MLQKDTAGNIIYIAAALRELGDNDTEVECNEHLLRQGERAVLTAIPGFRLEEFPDLTDEASISVDETAFRFLHAR